MFVGKLAYIPTDGGFGRAIQVGKLSESAC